MSVQFLTADEAKNMFISDDKHKAFKDELSTYLNVVKDNPMMFSKITDFYFVCGSNLEPDCCSPIDEKTKSAIIPDVVFKIVSGMKIDGEFENWSCGFMGSRWFDMDAKKYGISYIRVAFYSKKLNGSQRNGGNKPFSIVITAEKAKE